MADKTMDEATKVAFDFFTNYVSERNISIMTKAEWEMLYFYCVAKRMFPGKSLVNLTAQNLYALGEQLRVDFAKVCQLLKKCYQLEYEKVKEMTFHTLFDENAVLDPRIEGGLVKFGVANALAQERIEEILATEGIFSDSSFKKSVFSVPVNGMLMLLDKEKPIDSFFKKLMSIRDTVIKDIVRIAKPNETQTDSITTQLRDSINHATLHSAATFIVQAANIVSKPVKTVCDIVLPKLTDSNPAAVLSTALGITTV